MNNSPDTTKGAVVLNGGGGMGPYFELIQQYAGSADAPIVTIPTGMANASNDRFAPGVADLRDAGFTDIAVLHTNDREEANKPEFVRPITVSRAVLIHGGLTSPILDAYEGTLVQTELHSLLARGGVVAGFSAGACVVGSVVLERPLYDVMGCRAGFGLMKDVIVDVHVIARNQHYDLPNARRSYPTVIGFGLDEKANVVVHDGFMTVHGSGYVVVNDTDVTGSDSERLYFLKEGDLYDFEKRMPLRRHWTSRPFIRARDSTASETPWDSLAK